MNTTNQRGNGTFVWLSLTHALHLLKRPFGPAHSSLHLISLVIVERASSSRLSWFRYARFNCNASRGIAGEQNEGEFAKSEVAPCFIPILFWAQRGFFICCLSTVSTSWGISLFSNAIIFNREARWIYKPLSCRPKPNSWVYIHCILPVPKFCYGKRQWRQIHRLIVIHVLHAHDLVEQHYRWFLDTNLTSFSVLNLDFQYKIPALNPPVPWPPRGRLNCLI